MKRAVFAAAIAATALTFGASVHAQKTTPKCMMARPAARMCKTEWTIDGANVSIEYGRPVAQRAHARQGHRSVRRPRVAHRRRRSDDTQDRQGAEVRHARVPAGTYTLYTIPTGGTWHLIVSKKTGQWGIPYPKGEDLGRAPMTLGKAPAAAEQLTITVQDTPAGGTLHIDWGTTRASIPFTVG